MRAVPLACPPAESNAGRVSAPTAGSGRDGRDGGGGDLAVRIMGGLLSLGRECSSRHLPTGVRERASFPICCGDSGFLPLRIASLGRRAATMTEE